MLLGLEKQPRFWVCCPGKRIRAVAQLVARLVRDQEVGGSNPPCPKKVKKK